VVIPRQHVDAMVQHALAEFPNEACGMLASRHGTVVHTYALRNADASPVSFRIDPQDQLRVMMEIDDHEWDLSAIFHSHTRTRAYPSPTDVRLAAYPDTAYVIVSLAEPAQPDVRAYRIVEDEITEEPIEVPE
jgi:proteasome lid subunit RPN8/RPN11